MEYARWRHGVLKLMIGGCGLRSKTVYDLATRLNLP
jgi:hypothetical protein